ncbi:MAG: thioredoxin [Candidatus Brocadiaceae bacterium]|nr:thioredoxin [Candidatus Brocadiaceae bacterium]
MSDAVKDVTDATFEAEVVKSALPVLVDLWAPWCGPCRMVGPVIDQIAEANAGKLKAYKLNVDENPATASKLGVSAIPTVVLFKGGKEVTSLRMIGAQDRQAYQQAVDDLLEG